MKALRVIGLILVLLLALSTGFLGGILTDRTVIIPLIGMANPFQTEQSAPAGVVDLDLIQEAFNTIEQNFADRESLQKANLTYGALTGMVDALGDTGHSRFLSPDMLASENRSIQGEFEGIGAILSTNEVGNPIILSPMDDSPAMRAGIQAGDIILKVDGSDVSQSSVSDVVSKVLGPAGTDVTLTLQNPKTGEIRDVVITRAKIVVHNVTWQMLPGTQVAHIRVAQFSQNVTNDLQDAIQQAKDQGAQGILLDLRNNPGGLLNEAIGITSQFIGDGSVMQSKDAQGNITPVPVKRGGVALDIPLVVLINQGSASAAEITAGALQDYERAELVGQTTFGTGTVLNQFKLSDGSALLLATEMWLTPNGREIWHQGIAPDVTVDLPLDIMPSIPETERSMTAEELQNSQDAQLKKGLEILLQKITQ